MNLEQMPATAIVSKSKQMPATAIVSKIQRYSTKDGPGLRTTVFLSGCNLACLWCANPDLIPAEPQVFHYPERCTQCGRCVEVAVEEGSIRFAEIGVEIDRDKCTNLMECAASCYYDAYEVNASEMSSVELFDEILKDLVFYKKSGGGVTFSGGEPLLKHAFLVELLPMLKREGIHVTIDTAGLLPRSIFEQVMDYVDLFLYDIKAFDSKSHVRGTGVPNEQILRNAEFLAAQGKSMIVRFIVVPGYTDDVEDMRARIAFIASLGAVVQQVDILKYHSLGEGKYRALGLEYPLKELPEFDEQRLADLLTYADSLGVNYQVHSAF